MGDVVRIKSGEQPRYFAFSSALSTTSNGNSTPLYKESPWSTFQVIITGTGAVSATVTIQGSNQETTFNGTKSNWVTINAFSMTGTTSDTQGFTSIATWRYVRAVVASISGTGATVEIIMGV